MVDPKRHINILSEEDQLFLNECEEEFGDRFSEQDAEFVAHCAQPARAPPVVEPWQSRNFQGGGGGGYGGGGGRGRFNDRGGRGGGGRYNHHNRNRDYRDRPYHQQQQRGGGGGRYNNNNRGGRDNNRYNSVGRNYS